MIFRFVAMGEFSHAEQSNFHTHSGWPLSLREAFILLFYIILFRFPGVCVTSLLVALFPRSERYVAALCEKSVNHPKYDAVVLPSASQRTITHYGL